MKVCDELRQNKKDSSPWWLQALDLIEKKDASNDIMKKIDEAVSGSFNGSKSPRISSRFFFTFSANFLLASKIFFLIFLFAEVFNIKNFGMLDDINMPYLSLTSEENNNEYLFKL